jgi:hypothetical protein
LSRNAYPLVRKAPLLRKEGLGVVVHVILSLTKFCKFLKSAILTGFLKFYKIKKPAANAAGFLKTV